MLNVLFQLLCIALLVEAIILSIYPSFHFLCQTVTIHLLNLCESNYQGLFHEPFFISVNIFIWLVNVSDYKVIKIQPIFTFVYDTVSIKDFHEKKKQVLVLPVLDTRRTCRAK